MTYEQIEAFKQWQLADPKFRKLEITIKMEKDGSHFTAIVYDSNIHALQIVKDVSEIDLIGRAKADLVRQQKRLEELGA